MRIFSLCTLLLMMSLFSEAQIWKPANGPLMTRWSTKVSPDNALPEYPRPTMIRNAWLNLNGLWEYEITSKSVEKIPTSFTGKILVPYPIESALSGVMKKLDPSEKLWYNNTFTIPEKWKGERVLLHFGAVDWDATVYINDQLAGCHQGGYDAFTIDITPYLKEAGSQKISVSVWDPNSAGRQLRGKQSLNPAGAFYTSTSGIWQTVWLEPVPASSISKLKILTDAATGNVIVHVEGDIIPSPLKLQVSVLENGKAVTSKNYVIGSEIDAAVNENLTWYKAKRVWSATDCVIKIPSAKLWSPERPYLYDLKVTLINENGSVTDEVMSYFGIRSIQVKKDAIGNYRPYLNGKELSFFGVLDQGFWPDGIYTAPTDEALKFDIEAAKKTGLNTIRKHIKVEPERYYYWADKLGLLIFQDMPSGEQGDPFTDAKISPKEALQSEMEMRVLIQQRINHPSIICWNMFNEGWGQYETIRHATWAKQLDPSRLVNEASGFPRHGGGDVIDTHGGNAPKGKGKISMDSETAGYGIEALNHSWPGKLWASGTYDSLSNKEGATASTTDHPLYPLTTLSGAWYTSSVINLYKSFYKDRNETGSSGDLKVQLYDVEVEGNGLLSYDREVWKSDPQKVAAAINELTKSFDKKDQSKKHIL